MNPKWPQEKFNFSDNSWKQISSEENYFHNTFGILYKCKKLLVSILNLTSKNFKFSKMLKTSGMVGYIQTNILVCSKYFFVKFFGAELNSKSNS